MADTTTTTDTGAKRKRKLMVTYINAAAPGSAAVHDRLGPDLEELNTERQYRPRE